MVTLQLYLSLVFILNGKTQHTSPIQTIFNLFIFGAGFHGDFFLVSSHVSNSFINVSIHYFYLQVNKFSRNLAVLLNIFPGEPCQLTLFYT
jgi:hypothetical protein